MRIVARSVAAETASQIWRTVYEIDVTDVFAAQDKISRAVAHAIWPVLTDMELDRAMRKPTTDLGAWELYQRGMWHLRCFTRSDSEQALHYFHAAIAADPRSSIRIWASPMPIPWKAWRGSLVRWTRQFACSPNGSAVLLTSIHTIRAPCRGWPIRFCLRVIMPARDVMLTKS